MERLLDSRVSEPRLADLLLYVTDLELEVDRLRRHHQVVYLEARAVALQIQQHCSSSTAGDGSTDLSSIRHAGQHLMGVLQDLREVPGYHPAHDQVVAIAFRPLLEQVFRWQQRLLDAARMKLVLELEIDHVEWFPARLRHILDSLVSNAVRYRDPNKEESWVRVGLREYPENYKLRVSDNGTGLPLGMHNQAFDLFRRARPASTAGLGLAVVKMLIEQSGGSFTADSGDGQGTTVVALLPRFAIDDFLV
jgi:signal transduction histidine kinase